MELIDIAKLYTQGVISVKFLAKCRNLIYKVDCTKYTFVLRLINKADKDKEQIESELAIYGI